MGRAMRMGWVAALAALVALPRPAAGQVGAERAPASGATRYRNLQVLPGDVAPAVLHRSMDDNVRGLGIEGPRACQHCHVADDFASDEKPAKVVARRMMALVSRINRELGIPADAPTSSFRVTCATCHRGSLTPPPISGGG